MIHQNSAETFLSEDIVAAAPAFVLVGDVRPNDGVVEDGHANRMFDLRGVAGSLRVVGGLGTCVGALLVEARGCFAQGFVGGPLEVVGC